MRPAWRWGRVPRFRFLETKFEQPNRVWPENQRGLRTCPQKRSRNSLHPQHLQTRRPRVAAENPAAPRRAASGRVPAAASSPTFWPSQLARCGKRPIPDHPWLDSSHWIAGVGQTSVPAAGPSIFPLVLRSIRKRQEPRTARLRPERFPRNQKHVSETRACWSLAVGLREHETLNEGPGQDWRGYRSAGDRRL